MLSTLEMIVSGLMSAIEINSSRSVSTVYNKLVQHSTCHKHTWLITLHSS